MTIKKPVNIDQFDSFVSKANETVKPSPKGVIRGKKQIITVGFSPELLERIDACASASGISRAAFISLACSRAVADS